MCFHKRKMPPDRLILTNLVIDKFSVYDCRTTAAMRLMLMHFRLPNPPQLVTPSVRMIWVPRMMGVLSGGSKP